MTWLGKILAFVVFFGVAVWMYFTVSAYATRTNWKTRADAYEKAFKESETNREKEARNHQATVAALKGLYAAEKTRAEEYAKNVEDLGAAGRKVNEDYKQLEAKIVETDVQTKQRDARIKTIQDELKATRERSNTLEDRVVSLVLAKEIADRERLRAENEAKLQRSVADENARKVESLTSLVTELRQTGGSGTAAVLRSIERQPAPLPENIRGTVLRDMAGDYVHINLGIDAGLEPGSKLDVYRLSNGGKYLGTLTVTKTLYPKEAIAQFQPARPVPISQLRPDELPRKGDTVGLSK